jgi:hypothetical protein
MILIPMPYVLSHTPTNKDKNYPLPNTRVTILIDNLFERKKKKNLKGPFNGKI